MERWSFGVMRRNWIRYFPAPKIQCAVVVTDGLQVREDYSAAELSARLTRFSVSSPEAFVSSCWIFNSASVSLD